MTSKQGTPGHDSLRKIRPHFHFWSTGSQICTGSGPKTCCSGWRAAVGIFREQPSGPPTELSPTRPSPQGYFLRCEIPFFHFLWWSVSVAKQGTTVALDPVCCVLRGQTSRAGLLAFNLAPLLLLLRPLPPSPLQGMQAVIHRQPLPSLLDQYHPPSLPQPRPNPAMMPTPPVVSRKRKRAHQYTVSYSEVQEIDNQGHVREVIVIEDTPPSTISPATTHTNAYSASYQPPPYSAPIRTRARAAAEAQAMSASTSSAVLVAPAPKKRKRDQADDPRGTIVKKVTTGLQQQVAALSSKSWASGSGPATADVRNILLTFSLPPTVH